MIGIGFTYVDEIAARDARRAKIIARKPNLDSEQSYRYQSWGSAECASSSMASIYDAYNEYKNCENW